jgi:hypothetical protein
MHLNVPRRERAMESRKQSFAVWIAAAVLYVLASFKGVGYPNEDDCRE